jgi:hypothetical protein
MLALAYKFDPRHFSPISCPLPLRIGMASLTLTNRMPARPVTSVSTRSKPDKVSLGSRTHVDLFDHQLVGEAGAFMLMVIVWINLIYEIPGADIVIEKIRNAHGVTRLILSLNKLGDLGCIRLFGFLRSPEGKALDHINELSLNSNGIGDVGILALAEWLWDHQEIREIYLQNV